MPYIVNDIRKDKNKLFMTHSEADVFINENCQFIYKFQSCKTKLGEEPCFVYVDHEKENIVKYLVIRDEIDYPSLFVFGVFSDGEQFFTTPLHEGQEALNFVTEHEESDWSETLKMFTDKDDAEAAHKFLSK